MIFSVAGQKASLRGIEAHLFNSRLQRELGFESLSISPISRALRRYGTSIIEGFFSYLVSLIHLEERGNSRLKVSTIDSPTFSLNKTRYPWAEFRATKSGVKLHLRLAIAESGNVYPDKLSLKNACVHDINQLEVLNDQKEATYIYVRGYLDFKMFDQLSHKGFFFVTRIRKNSLVHIMNSYAVPPGSNTVNDQMVVLGRSSDYLTDLYRLVEVTDTKRNRLCLITNRFDISAEETGLMYRSRSEIELFFKHLKEQTVRKSKKQNGNRKQLKDYS